MNLTRKLAGATFAISIILGFNFPQIAHAQNPPEVGCWLNSDYGSEWETFYAPTEWQGQKDYSFDLTLDGKTVEDLWGYWLVTCRSEGYGNKLWLDNWYEHWHFPNPLVIRIDTSKLSSGSHTLLVSQSFRTPSINVVSEVPSAVTRKEISKISFQVQTKLDNPIANLSIEVPRDTLIGTPFKFRYGWRNEYSRIPVTLSASIKQNGKWRTLVLKKEIVDAGDIFGLINPVLIYESKAIVVSTLDKENFLKVKVTQNRQSWTKIIDLNTLTWVYPTTINSPTRAKVGSATKMQVQVKGIQEARCEATISYLNRHHATVKTENYWFRLKNGTASISTSMKQFGWASGTTKCYAPKRKIGDGSFWINYFWG
jgi:hypothetical protein